MVIKLINKLKIFINDISKQTIIVLIFSIMALGYLINFFYFRYYFVMDYNNIFVKKAISIGTFLSLILVIYALNFKRIGWEQGRKDIQSSTWFSYIYNNEMKIKVWIFIVMTIILLIYLKPVIYSGNFNCYSHAFSWYYIYNPNYRSIIWGLYPIIYCCYILLILILALINTRSIYRIIIGTSRVASGDLNYNLEEKGNKSLKELASNINRIKDGLKISVEEQMKNERLKSELVANFSHDLKTPLTSIINYLDLLQRKDITQNDKEEYLVILNSKSQKLKVLIEDLFEISKINSGKVEMEKEEIDIVELVGQALAEFDNIYVKKNIKFKINSFEDSVVLELDGKRISRVFENLISNALKYSMPNTRVYIDIFKEENNIIISFKNISEVEINFDKEEILERFKRGDQSRNSNIEGHGLGLAIANSIVELHQGKLLIETEGDLFKVFVVL